MSIPLPLIRRQSRAWVQPESGRSGIQLRNPKSRGDI